MKRAKLPPIDGEFDATIILNPPDKRRSDIDNRIKVLLDLAQKYGLVKNDYLCRKLTISYGSSEDAPLGAKLILKPHE